MPSVMKSKEPARFQAGREHDVVDVFVLAVRARSLVRGIAPERVDRLAHPREVSQSWITVDCGEADRQAELAEREPLLRGSPEIRLMSVVLEADASGSDNRVAERAIAVELREARGVDQKAADAQRVPGRQRAGLDHRTKVCPRLGEVGPTGRRRLELQARDVAVERIVMAHRRDQRTHQIDAHLPVHAARTTRLVDEAPMRGVGELSRPGGELAVAGHACGCLLYTSPSPRD